MDSKLGTATEGPGVHTPVAISGYIQEHVPLLVVPVVPPIVPIPRAFVQAVVAPTQDGAEPLSRGLC